MNGTDARLGAALSQRLEKHLAPVEFRTVPQAGYSFLNEPASQWGQAPSPDGAAATEIEIPKLLGAYLMIGAWICAAPALDRAFGTIDFLTLLDLERLSPRFLGKP